MHPRRYSPLSRTSSSNSMASTSSLDMEGLPPRSSLCRLLNPVNSNYALPEGHKSLAPTWKTPKPVSVTDKVVHSHSLKRKPDHANEGASSKRPTMIQFLHGNHITSTGRHLPDEAPNVIIDDSHSPTVKAIQAEKRRAELKPCYSKLVLDPFVDVTFDEHNRLVESDRSLIKWDEMRPLANGSGQPSSLPDLEDVPRECQTKFIRMETEGDAAYTRWDTNETSAFLNWMLGPNTKVRWDEFARGDQGLYFELAAQELFNGQRSKSAIRNKWDRMMNTYKHMTVFAEFTGSMHSLPNHGQLKKLLALASRKRKNTGSLTAHIVQQWYAEGWFTLCYSRLGKSGQTVVGKPNETAKKQKIITDSGGNTIVETATETIAKPAKSATDDMEAEELNLLSGPQNSLLMNYHQPSTGPEDSNFKDSYIVSLHDIDKVMSPTAHIDRTSSELDESEIVPQSSAFSFQRSDTRRDKILLALDVLDADDEEIRSAARDRLVAEWRRGDPKRDIKYDVSERQLRLQIAKVLLRVGSGEIKEEAKRALMSELQLLK